MLTRMQQHYAEMCEALCSILDRHADDNAPEKEIYIRDILGAVAEYEKWEDHEKRKLHGVSSQENEVFAFVKALCPDAEQSNRTVLGGKELDVFVPSRNIAIEVNGVYWHCDKRKDKKYHYNKWLKCKEQGINLIQITDIEWDNNREKFERILRCALKVGDNEVLNAEDCEVVQLKSSECEEFHNKYNPMGYAANEANFALIHNSKIVAIVSFGFGKNSRGVGRASGAVKAAWELSRFSASHQIVGAAAKLFKAFVEKYQPEEVRAFGSNDYFFSDIYEGMGFAQESVSVGYRVYHHSLGLMPRQKWQRRNIPKRLKELGKEELNFNPDKTVDERTEFQMEDLVGALRIWDSGKIRWTWKPKNH